MHSPFNWRGAGVVACAILLCTALPAQERFRAIESAATNLAAWSPDARKARQAYQDGQRAEQAGHWKEAFQSYSRALGLWPFEETYLRARENVRLQLVQRHIQQAELEALGGRWDRARAELLSALGADPTDPVARERFEQLAARSAQTAARAVDLSVVQVRPQTGARAFRYRGDTRGAYEEIAGAFGVRALFDPDLPSRPVRFDAPEVDFETAVRLLGQQTGTFWRALGERTIFVAQDTPEKRRQYAPTVSQVLSLPNLAGQDRATETLRLISEIAGITQSQFDTRVRTVTLRGSPDAVALATALLLNLEEQQQEMMLEVEVIEIDRAAARRLGVTPPSSARVVTLTPQDVEEAFSSVEGLLRVIQRLFGSASLPSLSPQQIAALIGSGQLNQLALIPPLIAFGGGRSVFLATLPGAAAEFSETLSVVRRGRRMLLRGEDGKQATFFVGERFPISSGTLTPALFDPRLAPFLNQVTVQTPFPGFQYEDLGIKVRVTPRLHPENEVTLHLQFEIRSLTAQQLNGIPVLSSRGVEQTVRLRENQTTVVTGILQDEERRAVQGWPGLSQPPGAGYLAGRRDKEMRETELLIFLTPRRLRLAPRADFSLYAGRDPVGATGPAPRSP